MRRFKPPTARNKIDLADASQVRILKRRLGISSDDLHRAVAKVGNSIAAVTKEIELQKPLPSTAPAIAPAPVQNDSALPSAVGVTAPV
jgi:translation elongation factor EF-4